jgi:hypothetical protein
MTFSTLLPSEFVTRYRSALVLPGQRLVSGSDAQLRVKNVKDSVQRASVGVILDFHGSVFDAFASVRAGYLEGQVEACHVSRVAQDSGFFVLSRNCGIGEHATLPSGNILASLEPLQIKYSRTVTLC